MSATKVLPYGAWPSAISTDLLVGSTVRLGGVAADGSDLLFTDDTGAPLSHEIEEWNVGAKSFVWVKAPSIAGAKPRPTPSTTRPCDS